ncbi:MAG: M56 family metallopeptidase [Gemmatimonadota bacterium]
MARTPLLVIGAWLLTYLLHSTALVGATALLLSLAPRLTSRVAETAWRVALFGGVVTATAQLLLVAFGSPLIGFASASVTGSLSLSAEGAQWLAGTGNVVLAASLTRIAVALVVIWAGIAALRLLALLRAHRDFRRSLAYRTPLRNADIISMVNAWCVAVGSHAGMRLSVSSGIITPMVLGANEVCVPERALEQFTMAELEAALAHEVAHVVRHDRLWVTLSAIVERALFLQPLNRVAHRRLRTLAECACDDWALRRTRDPVALASALTQVTDWLSGRAVHALAVGMAAGHPPQDSLAVARVRRILDPAAQRFMEHNGRVHGSLATTMLVAIVFLLPHVPPSTTSSASDSSLPLMRYTINAHDDAGLFTLTVQNQTVVGVTIDGVSVAGSRIRHAGRRVFVIDSTGRPALDLTLTGSGGISWKSRLASSTQPKY